MSRSTEQERRRQADVEKLVATSAELLKLVDRLRAQNEELTAELAQARAAPQRTIEGFDDDFDALLTAETEPDDGYVAINLGPDGVELQFVHDPQAGDATLAVSVSGGPFKILKSGDRLRFVPTGTW